ncbi:MAG: DNA pilot protein [Microvirus sp.]|nr:MAG: DNA pilot protein [Microvirus sp.]
MPFPLGAALNLGGDLVNGIAGIFTNKANKKYATQMYDRQRSDSLADWNMQNQYNSPAEQMSRFKEAGLNPNLIYGQMSNSPTVRSSSVPSYEGKVPQISPLSNTLMQSYDMKLKDAQVNLIKAQTDVAEQQKYNVAADTSLKGSNTDMVNFNLGKANSLLGYDLQGAGLKNQLTAAEITKKQADTQFTLDENMRQALTNSQNLEMGVQKIANMKLEGTQTSWQTKEIILRANNLIKTGQMQDFEIQLNKKGITRNDPVYYRAAIRLLQGETVDSIINTISGDSTSRKYIQDLKDMK